MHAVGEGRLPTCSSPVAGPRGSLPAEPCVAPMVTWPGHPLPQAITAEPTALHTPAGKGWREPRGGGGGGGQSPAQTKPALRSPPQRDFVPPGSGRPQPPANPACGGPREAKRHCHSPWEDEKNCYSPSTKIFLVFLPLAAASS